MLLPGTSSDLKPHAVTQESFAGGMRDRDHPSLLDENQYANGKNVEIRDAGLAKMRSGRTQKAVAVGATPQGGFFYEDANGNEYLIQVNEGKVYYWQNSGTAWTRIGTTQFSNASTNVGNAVLNGRLFIAPGTSDNVHSWTGSGSLTDEGNTNADPPRCKLLAQQAGRLISAGEAAPNQDYIRYSDIFDGQTWDRAANNDRVPTNGSEEVLGIDTYRKEEILTLTPFSTHSWNISGSSVSAFSRLQLDSKVGCIAPRSLVVVGDDAFFLSADRQIRTIKRTVQDLAFGVSNPITFMVSKLMARINATYAHLCAAVYFNNYYLLAAPMDNNTRNSSVIAFDMLHQFQTPSGLVPVCVGEWTNIAVNQFVVTYFGGIQRLHYIDANDGSVKQMFDDSSSDDGTGIAPQIDVRAFDHGAPNHSKTAHGGEFQFVNSSGTATLAFSKDDATWVTLGTKTIGDTGATLPVALPFNLPSDSGVSPWIYSMYRQGRSKYWQLRLTFTGSSMSLKQFTFRSWIENFVTR